MAVRRLLISYAHPDDESFGLGGLIARYVKEGIEVYLICATNGDVGTVAPEMLEGYNSIAELRLAELDCASEYLGLAGVYKLGFKDSGMIGSETSQDPTCLWQAPQEVVTRRVVEVIREVKPQVVITFNKYGGYGHPDHIAIQRATLEAFQLAGDVTYVTEGHAPYKPKKLYYSNPAKRQLQYGILLMRLRGQDPRRLGKNKDIDMQKIIDNIEQNHAYVDVSAYFEQWDTASNCHTSQLGGTFSRLPLWIRKMTSAQQGFTRIYPEARANEALEHDLFAGVDANAAI